MFYILMHKKTPVADVSIDSKYAVINKIFRVLDIDHFPIGTVQNGTPNRDSLNEWWRGRGIPASRSGLREAIETLGISSEKELLSRSLGLSLSDHYWICPKDSGLTWEQVNFFENPFSSDVGDILFNGKRSSREGKINLVSPDNTSDGWLKKRWVIQNGARKLVKAGSPPYYQEPYNEVLASALCKRLNIPHIDYKLIPDERNPASICEDFIDAGTELISAWYISKTAKRKNDVSLYDHLAGCCEKKGISISGYFDRMITLDYLIANTDRHLNNFGIIRNADTLEWIGPAPVFDSGTSLWHNADINMIDPSGKIDSKPFRSMHNDQIKLVKDFSWLDFNALKSADEELEAIFTNNVFIRQERRDTLCGALKARVKSLHGIVQGQAQKHSPEPDYDYDP